jgi:hypothetical protein
MSNPFFDHPILNSSYECPQQHWELDDSGQPIQQKIATRRRAEFITPIPKPKKRKGTNDQTEMVFDEGKGISTKEQQYDPNPIINEIRGYVETSWRGLPPSQWHEMIPLQERVEQVGEDSDLKEGYDTERHLLYVACTRARDFVLITAAGPASEFLDDMGGG